MPGIAVGGKKMKEKPNVSFSFPKESKVQPEGFEKLRPNGSVTVLIEGRLSGLSDRNNPWDQGKRFDVEIDSCGIDMKQEGTSLDEALEAAKKAGEQ